MTKETALDGILALETALQDGSLSYSPAFLPTPWKIDTTALVPLTTQLNESPVPHERDGPLS